MTIHVYAGPTISAHRILELLPAAVVHPPIRHGDLARLYPEPGDRVLIIDGLWHHVPSVRHKEILDVIDRGTPVIGAASMGALRAAELHPFGMIGLGWVFRAYRDGIIDADDEVAVIQTPDGRPLSEALVNIRVWAGDANRAGVLATAEAAGLLEEARGLPYHRRTWETVSQAAAAAELGAAAKRLHAWRERRPIDIKRQDAEQALAMLATGQPVPPPDTSWWRGQPWRTSFVRYWNARFRARIVDGEPVPFLAILAHQQLYDPGFPARWRALVLSWIAGRHSHCAGRQAADVEDRALATAAERGLSLDDLTAEQRGYWLTPAEIRTASPREALLRILVRSARLDSAAAIWPSNHAEAGCLINSAIPSARIAAAAFHLNDQTARAAPGRTIHHLRPDRIRDHLAELWAAAAADSAAMDAAARDRGFHDQHGAAEVARSFYLWAARHHSAVTSPAGQP
jgi:hypothetical protein